MSQVIVVGAPSDDHRARAVVEALHHHQVDLWWERGLATSEAVRRKAAGARCVLVLISADLLQNDGLAVLAQRAADSENLVIGRLDRTQLPPWSTRASRIDLSRFRRNKNDLFILDLVATVRAKVAGIDPPPARGPSARIMQRFALMMPGALFVLGVAANLLGLVSFKEILHDLRRPNEEESRAFSGIRLGQTETCEQLKRFNDTYKRSGYYYEDAMALIDNARIELRQQILPRAVSDIPATQPAMEQPPYPDALAARTKASEGAKVKAEAICRETFAGPDGRFVSITITGSPEPQCDRFRDGYRCKAQVKFTCRYDLKQDVTVAICGHPPQREGASAKGSGAARL